MINVKWSILLFLFVACTQTVDIATQSDNRELVVHAFFEANESTLQLKIEKVMLFNEESSDYYDLLMPTEAQLYEDDILIANFSHKNKSDFEADNAITFKENATYQLEVEHPEFKKAFSTESLPLPSPSPIVQLASNTNTINLDLKWSNPIPDTAYIQCQLIQRTTDGFEVTLTALQNLENSIFFINNQEILVNNHAFTFQSTAIDSSNLISFSIDKNQIIDNTLSSETFDSSTFYLKFRLIPFDHYFYIKQNLSAQFIQTSLFTNFQNGQGIFSLYRETLLDVEY